MGSALRTLCVLGLVLALGAPAAATHEGEAPPPGCRWIRGVDTPEDHADDVAACRQDVWLHHGGTRAGNVASLDHAPLPSWNTSQPTTSFQDGGGFWFTNSITRQPMVPWENARGAFVARGSFTGVLDNLAIEFYAYATALSSQDLNLELVVDDQPLFLAAVPDVTTAAVGNFQRVRFAFTDLYEALEKLSVPNGPSASHTIRVSAGGVWVVNDPMVWAYDATDAPAGMIFNNEALTGYTVLDTAQEG